MGDLERNVHPDRRLATSMKRRIAAAVLGVGAVVAGGFALMSTPATSDDLSDTMAPVEAESTQPEVSEPGHVLKSLGESGGLISDESEVFTLTVHGVQSVTTCPGRAGEIPPTSGRFLVLDVEAVTSAEFTTAADGSDPFMPLLAETFVVYDGDGEPQVGLATEAAWNCYPDDELLPGFISAGEHARGFVVLDTGIAQGSVAYSPGGAGGWEWAFDAQE